MSAIRGFHLVFMHKCQGKKGIAACADACVHWRGSVVTGKQAGSRCGFDLYGHLCGVQQPSVSVTGNQCPHEERRHPRASTDQKHSCLCLFRHGGAVLSSRRERT